MYFVILFPRLLLTLTKSNKKVDNIVDCVNMYIQLENRRTAYVYVKMFSVT